MGNTSKGFRSIHDSDEEMLGLSEMVGVQPPDIIATNRRDYALGNHVSIRSPKGSVLQRERSGARSPFDQYYAGDKIWDGTGPIGRNEIQVVTSMRQSAETSPEESPMVSNGSLGRISFEHRGPQRSR